MIKKILILFLLFSFLPVNSALSDSKILSPEDYVTYIAQETLDVLGNKNKSTAKPKEACIVFGKDDKMFPITYYTQTIIKFKQFF